MEEQSPSQLTGVGPSEPDNPPAHYSDVSDEDDYDLDNIVNTPVPTIEAKKQPPIPPGKSIAHHYIKAHSVVYWSLDIETGGEHCGIVQLSAK